MTEADFSLRLAHLREQKGVSARDMSLSMGQNPGYINNIETGKSMPSLSGIFYICDYLRITPCELFDMETKYPHKLDRLMADIKRLNCRQLDCVDTVVQNLLQK
jgi:transcriptional regulator with XRE-family HTH domain